MSLDEKEFHRPTSEVLRIGRNFQNSDKFHGCTYETAKLLCDEIEYLESQLRNCGCSVCGGRHTTRFYTDSEAREKFRNYYPCLLPLLNIED